MEALDSALFLLGGAPIEGTILEVTEKLDALIAVVDKLVQRNGH
jgi:hypothetical protein